LRTFLTKSVETIESENPIKFAENVPISKLTKIFLTFLLDFVFKKTSQLFRTKKFHT